MSLTVSAFQTETVTSLTPSVNITLYSLHMVFQILLNTSVNWNSLNNKEITSIKNSVLTNLQKANSGLSDGLSILTEATERFERELEKRKLKENDLLKEIEEKDKVISNQKTSLKYRKDKLLATEDDLSAANRELEKVNKHIKFTETELSRVKKKKRKGFLGIPIVGEFVTQIAGLSKVLRVADYNVKRQEEDVRHYTAVLQDRRNDIRRISENLEESLALREQKQKTVEKINVELSELRAASIVIQNTKESLSRTLTILFDIFENSSEQASIVTSLKSLVRKIIEICDLFQPLSKSCSVFHQVFNFEFIGENTFRIFRTLLKSRDEL